MQSIFQLTQQEFEALKSVYIHRSLSVPELEEILSYTPIKQPSALRTAQDLLDGLEKKGLIKPVQSNDQQSFWSVTNSGVWQLREDAYFRGSCLERFEKSAKQINIHPSRIKHQRNLNSFVIPLLRELRNVPGVTYPDKMNNPNDSQFLQPDGIITIPKGAITTGNWSNPKINIYLESDLNTENMEQIYRKMPSYDAYLNRTCMPGDWNIVAFFCYDSAIPFEKVLHTNLERRTPVDKRKESRHNKIKDTFRISLNSNMRENRGDVEFLIGTPVNVLAALLELIFHKQTSHKLVLNALAEWNPLLQPVPLPVDGRQRMACDYSACVQSPMLRARFLFHTYTPESLLDYVAVGMNLELPEQMDPSFNGKTWRVIVLPDIGMLDNLIRSCYFPSYQKDPFLVTTLSSLATKREWHKLFFMITENGFAQCDPTFTVWTPVEKKDLIAAHQFPGASPSSKH